VWVFDFAFFPPSARISPCRNPSALILCFLPHAVPNDVKAFLARLVVLVAKGRISPRRAAVLAYITNQLLHTHRAIECESRFEQETNPQWPELGDLPRPRDDPYEDSDTIRMIRNITLASCNPAENVPEEKIS
jgi:hypothetical protein